MKHMMNRNKEMLCDSRRRFQAEAAKRAKDGPRMTVERGFLVMRWRAEDAAMAIAVSGLDLAEVVGKYIASRIDATKITYVRHHGQIMKKRRPDHSAQLKAVRLLFKLSA